MWLLQRSVTTTKLCCNYYKALFRSCDYYNALWLLQGSVQVLWLLQRSVAGAGVQPPRRTSAVDTQDSSDTRIFRIYRIPVRWCSVRDIARLVRIWSGSWWRDAGFIWLSRSLVSMQQPGLSVWNIGYVGVFRVSRGSFAGIPAREMHVGTLCKYQSGICI